MEISFFVITMLSHIYYVHEKVKWYLFLVTFIVQCAV
jgi:hypothetical protein